MSGFITVPTVAKTTHSVTCPCCGKYSWSVDHLFASAPNMPGGFYPVHWECNKCLEDFEIHVYGPDRVELKQLGKKANPFIPALVLLKSCHEDSPIYALVETSSHLKSIQESQLPEDHPNAGGGMRYYYDQHTCPTNWFRDVTKLIHEGDDDPHGVFTFVAAVTQEEAMAYLEKHHQTQRTVNHRGGGKPDVEFIEFSENVRLLFPQAFGEGHTLDGEVDRAKAPMMLSLDIPDTEETRRATRIMVTDWPAGISGGDWTDADDLFKKDDKTINPAEKRAISLTWPYNKNLPFVNDLTPTDTFSQDDSDGN